MKNIISKAVPVLVLLVFLTSSAMAADMPLKVGLIDLNKAVNESEQGKKAKVELETFIKGKQASLDEIGRKVESLKNELDKQGDAISDGSKKSKEDELARLSRDYQRMAGDSQVEVRKKESELTQAIIAQLRNVIKVVSEEDKYTLILEDNETLVLFEDKALDITDKIIRKFDESQQKSGKK